MNTQTLENTEKSEKIDVKPQVKITCGIIMPIAAMNSEYTEEHWKDVRFIIDTAIRKAGFEPRIVSDSKESTIIHKSIINNIYNDEIVVCDVSNKNANVMFELGMRLAFNKPVVIIKDDLTGYSFDTSNIEHIAYRKDLRHNTVEKFINDLARKIKATHEAPKKEDYQSFLSHFGKFEVAKIENKSIEGSEALEKLLNKMSTIESKIVSLSILDENNNLNNDELNFHVTLRSEQINPENLQNIMNDIKNKIDDVDSIRFNPIDNSLTTLFTIPLSNVDKRYISQQIKNIITLNDDELPF